MTLAAPLLAQPPKNLTDTPIGTVVPGGPSLLPKGTSLPGFTVFLDRSNFTSAAPGLPCEDFEEARVGAGSALGFPAPLDATTNNVPILPGEILPGIRFQDLPLNAAGGGSADGLVFFGSGFGGGSTSKLVLSNTFPDSFEIYFDPPVQAAGMDIVSYFTAGVTVELFGASSNPLGSGSFGAGLNGQFLGFVASQPVSLMRITATFQSLTGAEGVDNICFGTPSRGALEIPTLSRAGHVTLALFLGLGAFLALRRRTATPE